MPLIKPCQGWPVEVGKTSSIQRSSLFKVDDTFLYTCTNYKCWLVKPDAQMEPIWAGRNMEFNQGADTKTWLSTWRASWDLRSPTNTRRRDTQIKVHLSYDALCEQLQIIDTSRVAAPWAILFQVCNMFFRHIQLFWRCIGNWQLPQSLRIIIK